MTTTVTIVAAMEISHDITERVETEQQLIQASKMATLGEMATGIAHELNQPLSVIKTVSSFFLRKIEHGDALDMEALSTMLEKVDKNVDRATRIINHMRQFARKTDQELAPVQVNDVLRSAFEIFSQQLKVRSIIVKWSLAESLPKVKADPQRLEQVFINLLINARDAIEEKREQQHSDSEEEHIDISTEQGRQQVVCRICDTGIGVPEAVREKIFEPFFTTKEVGKGTGLGLSISYSIIKDYRGNIEVVAHAPQGACFVDYAAGGKVVETMTLSSPPISVLVVDDEQDIRDVLEMALMDSGYEVVTAENGRQALDLFIEKQPTIVITDIKMPVMDGIELLDQIKRRSAEAEVIMITGHGDMNLAIRSLKNEAADFILKPIDVNALEMALKRVRDRIILRRQLADYTTNLERLLKEKTELQDHLSSLGLMIGTISHGIKGLLTGLDGGMYLLESGLGRQDGEQITEGFETVKVMVERVRRLVLDICFMPKNATCNGKMWM